MNEVVGGKKGKYCIVFSCCACEVGEWCGVCRVEVTSVAWTEDKEWYVGTFTTSRVEAADGGGMQRSCCIVYDAVGPWASCSRAQLTYWHCLDDEKWERVQGDA